MSIITTKYQEIQKSEIKAGDEIRVKMTKRIGYGAHKASDELNGKVAAVCNDGRLILSVIKDFGNKQQITLTAQHLEAATYRVATGWSSGATTDVSGRCVA